MRLMSKKSQVIFASAVASTTVALFNHKAMGQQQYAVTNTFSVSAAAPYQVPDSSNANTSNPPNINYSSIAIATQQNNPEIPNGKFSSIVGTLTGTQATNAAVTVSNAYLYNAAGGLQLVGAYTETSTGSHIATTVTGVNPSAQVIGYQGRDDTNSASSSVLGRETWLSTPTGTNSSAAVFLGLFGPNNSYTQSTSAFGTTGTYSTQQAAYISSTGFVAGTSQRYEGDTAQFRSNSAGSSAWVYGPTTPNSNTGRTIETGLMGDGNVATLSYNNSTNTQVLTLPFYSNQVSAVNASGETVGSANEYTGTFTTSKGVTSPTTTGNGTDAWVYTGSPSTSPLVSPATRIGAFTFTAASILTYSTSTVSVVNNGTTYTETIPAPSITPASGSFAANSFAYGYVSTTATLGTTPAQQISRNNGIQGINTAGQLAINSSYYVNNSSTTNGQDAFIYTPGTGTYLQVGLTNDSLAAGVGSNSTPSFVSFNGRRNSSVNFINTVGQSAGTSNVYLGTADATGAGKAAWFATTTGTTGQIGLFDTSDGAHTFQPSGTTAQIPNETVTGMNDLGMVAGYANRYTSAGVSLGQDAWVYDPTLGSTVSVDPVAAGVFSNSQIYYLSPTGVAVGQYETSAAGPFTAFEWSSAGGFDPLDMNIPAGLSASGYQNLINADFTDSVGSSILATASFTNSNTLNGLATLTAVPEPTALMLVGLGSMASMKRRRKS